MSFMGPCHSSCAKEIENQIRDAVSKVYNSVSIETIVLHDNDKSPQPDGGNSKATTHHSFLVTVETTCRYEHEFHSDSPEVNPDDMFDMEELFDCTDGTDATLLAGEKPSLALSVPKTSYVDAAAYNNQFAGARIDNAGELSLFGNLPHATNTGGKNFSMDTFDLSVGVVEGFDDSVFPLSSDELHETINEQLEKSDPPVEKWQNPLFKDVPNANMGKGDTNNATASVGPSMVMVSELASSSTSHQHPQQQQQYQSNEISSSWDTLGGVAISTSHYHQSTTLIPQQILHPGYYFNPGRSASLTGLHPANFSLATQQHQLLCPANLPAVSALITPGGGNGGSSFNWAFPSAPSTGGVIKPTLIRMKKMHEQKTKFANGSSRPSMLLPKIFPSKTLAAATSSSSEPEKSSTETQKPRSRKASHAPQSVKSADEIANCFPSSRPSSSSTPEGHTYQTWIIQEGLKKPREKLKQEKKAEGRKVQKGKVIQRDGEAQSEKTSVATRKESTVRYVCPICGKSYGTANGIKYHAENGHGPKNVHVCDICNKEYGSRHGLVAHKKTHEMQAAAEALGKPI